MLKFFTFLLVTSCFVAKPSLASQGRCNGLVENPQTKRILSHLHNTLKLREPWKGYHPSHQTYFLTGLNSFKTCALAITHGRIDRIFELSEEIKIANGLYDFYLKGVFERLPKALENYLTSLSQQSTVILNVQFDMDAFGSAGERLAQGNDGVFISFLLHEGFHINVQGPSLFSGASGKHPWPQWTIVNRPDRNAVIESCYKSSEAVRKLYNQERIAIIAAFQLAEYHNHKNLAKEEVRRFVQLRNQRYEMLSEMGHEINCPEAEAKWEMIEGVAEYIGMTSRIEVDDIKRDQMISFLTFGEDSAPFYRLALLQLLVIKSISDDFSQVSAELATSTAWQNGIFGKMRTLSNAID